MAALDDALGVLNALSPALPNRLMRRCAQHDESPLPYLTDVLRKLANGWDQNRLEELLPDRCQLLRNERTIQVPTTDLQEA